MKYIFKYLKPHMPALLTVAGMHLIATLSALMMPYVMTRIVDVGIKGKDIDVIVLSAVMMLALAVVSLVTGLVSNAINSRVSAEFSSSVCRCVFEKINSLSPEQYSEFGSSGLLTRSTDDVFNIQSAAGQIVYTLVTVPIMLIGGTVLSFLSDPYLSLIFLLTIPPVLLIVVFIVKPLYHMWNKSDKYIDIQNKIVRDRLSGLRVIRAFNNEGREHNKAKLATEDMSKYIIKGNILSGYIYPVVMLFLNIATVILIYVGIIRTESGVITDAGAVISVIEFVALISNAVLTLSWTIAWVPHLRVSVGRISEVLSLTELDVSASDPKGSAFCADVCADIRLQDVGFSYKGASSNALSDISLNIKRGETVAIIGGTGSGKSTLIKLIIGLYKPTEGEIFINDVPYSSLSLADIRSAYSTALQHSMIFEGTLRNNVRLGKRDAEDAEIISALSDCGLSDFLAEHEEGVDFLLVGMGRNVSGGQKQRINMSRTVIRKAPVYVFDDSFSALDYLTEKRVQKNIFSRLPHSTKIIVTQRVSTALAAERIYVMDSGRITASGTHRELLLSSDIYKEICISQLGRDAVSRETRGGEA